MISVVIDTCTNYFILGVYKDKRQIYFEREEAKSDLSSKVLVHLKGCLDKLSLKIDAIDSIYVVNGPGSFTGIRVGVTIAKTLAWALNKKIYVLSELQLLASTTTDKKYNVSIIDARRGYVYAGMYDRNLSPVIEDQYIKFDDLKEIIEEKYSINDVAFISYDSLDDAIFPELDIEKVLNMVNIESLNPHIVNPNYLKKTEAEEKLNDKEN